MLSTAFPNDCLMNSFKRGSVEDLFADPGISP